MASAKELIERANQVHQTNPLGKFKYQRSGRPSIVKEDIAGVPQAFILKNVLTPEECEQFIKATEILEYTEAPITTGRGPVMMTDIRNNKRVMWQISDEDLMPIWERIREFMPKTFRTSERSVNVWQLNEERGMNERFRFYRYEAYDYFAPHYDGCYARNGSEQSHFTFIIYLNDGFEGGETSFFPDPRHQEISIKVNPRAGQALIFPHSGEHSPLHEGTPHTSQGKYKYALRSDIMYKHANTVQHK